jgi:hypothetical protein
MFLKLHIKVKLVPIKDLSQKRIRVNPKGKRGRKGSQSQVMIDLGIFRNETFWRKC